MPPLLMQSAALVGSLVGFALAVPQLVRLVRTRQTAGLSPASWVNGCLSYLAWAGYMVADRAWLLLATMALAAPVWFATTGLLLRCCGPVPAREWRLVAAWAAVVGGCAALAAAGWGLPLVVVLGGSAGAAYGPALVSAWRAADVSGIAAGSWWLALVDSLCQLGAGWGVPAALLYGGSASLMSAAVLARLALGDRGHHRPARLLGARRRRHPPGAGQRSEATSA